MESLIYNLVFSLFGLLLTAGGVIFNFAINEFVIGFGTQMDARGLGFVVNNTWAVLRDLFNLAFIFGLVFIGFKMILRIDDANSKRWLVSLIMAALLVNFSLFITKFVIDFSNIVAVEMINEGLNTQIANGARVFSYSEGTTDRVDISRSMKAVMKVDTTASRDAAGNKLDPENVKNPSWGLIFGTMLVFMIGAFVFFSAGILLIVRAVVLVLLMIVSPFLFIGMVFPGLQGSASKLWKMLFTRAIFAPLYITLLYITLWLAGDYTSAVQNGDTLAGALTADGRNADSETIANTFGPFIIVTAFLWISLVAAQRIGVEGGNRAVSVGKSLGGSLRKRVGGGAIRGSGALARNTVGKMAYDAANSDRGKRRAAGGFVDRQIAGFYKKVGETSFDGRSKSKDGNFGKGVKGGYAATMDAKEKAEKKRAKDLERNPYDKNGNPKADFETMRNADPAYSYMKSKVDLIEEKKKDLEDDLARKQRELKEKKDADTTLQTLKTQLAAETDAARQVVLEERIKDIEFTYNTEFENETESMAEELKKVNQSFNMFNKQLKTENARVEGDYKFELVDELKKTRKREDEMWTNLKEGSGTAGAVTGAAIGTMFAGPIGTAVGAAVGAAIGKATTNVNADTAATQTATITKEYGKDGRKKVKDQGANDILNKLKKEVEKDSGGSDDGDDDK